MFFAPEKFPFVRLFLDNWKAIHDEYAKLDAGILNQHRNTSHEEYFETAKHQTVNGWVPSWQAGSTEQNFDWLTYWLSWQGHFSAGTREKLPTLAAVLEQTPCVRLCAFSKMKPLSVIGAHRHPELGGDILTLHLGVDVAPATSYLHVEGAFAPEGNNLPVIFDGSQYHFAVNAGTQDRTILYIEFDQSKAN
jgi:aspartyl/asparaginyl beta-hydroxylase (cupin superfamily)